LWIAVPVNPSTVALSVKISLVFLKSIVRVTGGSSLLLLVIFHGCPARVRPQDRPV
jgi:hypothetical protein